MGSLNLTRKIFLAAAGIAALAWPIVGDVGKALPANPQSQAETAPPTFEVASVKLHKGGGGTTRRIEPGTITYLSITLGEFIEMAYGIKHYQLSGPDWIVSFGSSDRYDIIAKAASPVGPEQLKPMLRPLLAERFHLAFHRMTRVFPVYALVVAKGGPKIKPGDGGEESVAPRDAGGSSYRNYPMADLAYSLSLMASVGRPVLDRTGLQGGYSFDADLYDLPKDLNPAQLKDAIVNSDAFFNTLPEQLGLRLKSERAPLEILVIDNADKIPTEN